MKNTLVLIAVIFLNTLLFAQSSNIRGIVLDTKGGIPGALVKFQNSNIKTLTDINGEFSFNDILKGDYTLEIEALGYEVLLFNFNNDGLEDKNLGNLQLSQVNKIEEVSVTANAKNTENKAINMTKNAVQIVNVVSAETISKLPNKNGADVVARISGASVTRNKGEGSNISLRGTPIDWTATFLNGDRLPVADEENTTRSFDFQILPSNMIDYVIVTKSNTPDIEADNIGGSINFLSKSYVNKRTFGLNVAGGYNPLAQKPLGTLNFLYGDITKNKKFSFVVNGSTFARNYATDATKIIYGSNFNHGLNRLELKRYDGIRINTSANLAFEYRPNKKVKIGSHMVYSNMNDNKYQKKQSFNWYEGSGQRVRLQSIHGELLRQLYGGDIFTEIAISSKLKMKAKFATYNNNFHYGNVPIDDKKDKRNGYYTIEFISPLLQFSDQDIVSLYGQTIDPNDPNGFPTKLIGGDNPYGNGDSPSNIQPQFAQIFQNKPLETKDFEFYKAYTETNNTNERDKIVSQLDFEYKASNNLKLKVGSKYRNKEGYRHISLHQWFQDYSIPGNNSPIKLQDFELENFSQTPGGFLRETGANYQNSLFPFLTLNEAASFLAKTNGKMREVEMDKFNQEFAQWVGSSYDYKEKQFDAYGMAEYSFKNFNFVGGARFVHTNLYETSDTLTAELAYDSLSGSIYNVPAQRVTSKIYNKLLPSLNIIYNHKKNQNIKFAFSQSLKRPNFEQTKPGAAVVKYNDLIYIYGNPNLKPTTAFNFDLCYEYYWGNKGMWSVGGYFKSVYDNIFTVTTADIDPASGLMIKKYQNSDKAKVYGVEITFIRKFDFLPGVLKNFGLNTNITLSDSRMNVPGRPKAQKMTQQTPVIYNVALTYEKGGFNSRVALNYIGRHLQEVNLASLAGIGLLHKDSDFDIFMNQYYNLDIQCSYTFKKIYTFYLEGINLLDFPQQTSVGQSWRSLRTEYYRMRGQIGFKIDI